MPCTQKKGRPLTESAFLIKSELTCVGIILLEQLHQLDMHLHKYRSQHMRQRQLHTCHHLQR